MVRSSTLRPARGPWFGGELSFIVSNPSAAAEYRLAFLTEGLDAFSGILGRHAESVAVVLPGQALGDRGSLALPDDVLSRLHCDRRVLRQPFGNAHHAWH